MNKRTLLFLFVAALAAPAALQATESDKKDAKKQPDTAEHRVVFEINMEQAILERIRYAQAHPMAESTVASTNPNEDPLENVQRDYDTEVQKLFDSLY